MLDRLVGLNVVLVPKVSAQPLEGLSLFAVLFQSVHYKGMFSRVCWYRGCFLWGYLCYRSVGYRY